LDYVRWIGGEIVECRGLKAHVSELELDVDDVAVVVARHRDGALTTIRMDFLDRAYNRRSRWVGEEGTLAWQWRESVRLEPAGEVLWADADFDLDETYRAALRDFLGAAAGGRSVRCDGRDGLRVVELCSEV